MGHARVLSKIDDNKKIEDLAKKVVSNNMSVRDLENISTGEDIPKKVPINRVSKNKNDYKYVEDKLKEVLGTKVRVDNKKMEIYFNSSNDLTRILDILDIKID